MRGMHPQHQPGQQPSTPYQEWAPPPSPPPYLQGPPRRRKKSPAKMIVLIVVGAFVVLVAVGIALGGGEEKPVVSAPTASRTAAASSGVPEPDAGQRAAYLAALAEIDPGLVANEERAVRRGRAVCERILHPSSGGMTLRQYVVEELSGGNATINQAQAAKVVTAVKAWCS